MSSNALPAKSEPAINAASWQSRFRQRCNSLRVLSVAFCLALASLTLVVGLMAHSSQKDVGAVGARIYDNAFMSMSYLRSAQNRLLSARLASSSDENLATGTAVATALPEIIGDLEVVRTRAISDSAREIVEELEAELRGVRAGAQAETEIGARLNRIQSRFDVAVEIFAGDGYKKRQSVDALIANSLQITAISTGISLLAALMVGFLFSTAVVSPILKITAVMTRLAKGNSDIKVPSLHRQDEIGAMARALEVFRVNAFDRIRLGRERDADRDKQVQRARDIYALCAAHDNTVQQQLATLEAAATTMEQSSEHLNRTVAETSRQTAAATAAVEEASSNLSAVSESAESVLHSSDRIIETTERSVVVAQRARTEATSTETCARQLDASAGHIGKVVEVIGRIAAQTNLLALNATIEAARAGDAGRGFSVVATEVKTLATETMKATSEIADQISAIQTATAMVVSGIATVNATIDDTLASAKTVVTSIQQQGMTAKVIAEHTQRIADSAGKIALNVRGVSSGVEINSEASASVLLAAQKVRQRSDSLKSEIAEFLTNVRAS